MSSTPSSGSGTGRMVVPRQTGTAPVETPTLRHSRSVSQSDSFADPYPVGYLTDREMYWYEHSRRMHNTAGATSATIANSHWYHRNEQTMGRTEHDARAVTQGSSSRRSCLRAGTQGSSSIRSTHSPSSSTSSTSSYSADDQHFRSYRKYSPAPNRVSPRSNQADTPPTQANAPIF